MYNGDGLIPARFLTLVAHFVVCTNLLWSSKETVRSCLVDSYSETVFYNHHTQLVIGLSVALAMVSCEMLGFLTGMTMFDSTSALLSIGCHATACILLCYFVFDGWHCAWFWWIFVFCSVLPLLNDVYIIVKEVGHSENTKWTKLLILAGAATTIGLSLPVGFNIGVVNTPAHIIKAFCNESMFTRYGAEMGPGQLDFLWSAIVSIYLVGGSIGSLGGSWLADRVGRKGALVTSGLLAVAAGVLFSFCMVANSVEMLVAGRLLIGLASGLITCVMPMYLTELAPTALRGSMGVMCPLGITFGVLLGQIVSMPHLLGTEEAWPYCLGIYIVFVLLAAVASPLLPESPKYLYVVKKQTQIAVRVLSKIREMNEESLAHEIQEMKIEQQDSEAENQDTWSIGRVLADKTLLLPLLLVCALQAGQQMSGINAVFFYSFSIFKSADLSDMNSQLATIGAGLINLLMAIISIPVMARVDRRTTLQISLSLTAVFLVVLGTAIRFISTISWMPYLSIVGVLGFVLTYGIGLGPIPYFIGSELFEVGPRPAAMALGSMANWGGNFMVALAFPTMNNCIGAISFYIFAAITISVFLFVKYYLPETRNRDPCDIALLCRGGFSSKPLSSPLSSNGTTESFSIAGVKEV